MAAVGRTIGNIGLASVPVVMDVPVVVQPPRWRSSL